MALRRPELPSSQPLRKVLQAEVWMAAAESKFCVTFIGLLSFNFLSHSSCLSQDLTEQQKKSIAQHLEEAVEKAIEKDHWQLQLGWQLSAHFQFEKELLGLDIVHLLLQVG